MGHRPDDVSRQATTASSDQRGRVLSGRYALGPVIGRGGMGEVRRARDERLGRDVAIKLLHPALAANHGVRERFEHEAQAAARLSHPHAVMVFDTDEDNGEPYIVMECLPGQTLADELQAGPISVARAHRLATQVLDVLSAAHRLGIVHRDIKPSNLLIFDDATFKVCDFGIAKSADGLDYTATGELLGTVAYLAPERLEGQAATPSSDLYALGVVLYEALTGAKPFDAETPIGLAYLARSSQPVPLRSRRPDVDDTLAGVVERAMAKNPDDRYGSADDMAAALQEPAADSTVVSTTMPSDDTDSMDATATLGPATAVFPVPPAAPTAVVSVPPPPRANHRGVFVLAAIIGAFVIVILVTQNSRNAGPTTPTTQPTTAATAPTTVKTSATRSTSPLPAPLDHAIDQLDQAVQS